MKFVRYKLNGKKLIGTANPKNLLTHRFLNFSCIPFIQLQEASEVGSNGKQTTKAFRNLLIGPSKRVNHRQQEMHNSALI
jgi:hypothetical protein